jgi:hypothetical protein
MTLAVEPLTDFAVVIPQLQAIPVVWMFAAAVVCLTAWVAVAVEIRRNRQPQEDRVSKQPSRAA